MCKRVAAGISILAVVGYVSVPQLCQSSEKLVIEVRKIDEDCICC